MQENKYEEKKKDEIVQAIYDTLESEGWGSQKNRVVFKLVFVDKFIMKQPIVIKKPHLTFFE